jgi:hypothetical protein
MIVPGLPTFTVPEFDELNASAVAVAPTVAPVRPQIRAKKVGKSVRWTFTVTLGFTANVASIVLQSELFGNVTWI